MVFCEKCGAENPEDADICEVCDAKLKKPLHLFKKKGKKEEEEEEEEEEELPRADVVRAIDVQSISASNIKGTVSRLIGMLEESGLSDYETEEIKKPSKEQRDLVEAIDSKIMEIEMKAREPLEPPTIYMLLGNTYFNTGELSRAERFYEKAVEQDANYIEALLRVVKRHISKKENERAMAVIEKTLARSPKYAEALYYKSRLLKERGDLKDALKFSNDAIKADKADEKAWLLRAEIYELMGDTQKCFDSLNAGIATIPSSISLLERKGELLVRMGKGSEAVQMVDAALKTHKNDANLQALYGKILMTNGEFTSAERAFDRALEIDEECVSALVGLGSMLGMQGEYETSHEYLDTALEIDPKNSDAHIAKSLIHARQGDMKLALENADKAISLHPENADVWKAKGDLLASHGLYSEAVEIYNKILDINPGNAAVTHQLGVAYANLKKTNEAIAMFKRTIEASRNYAPVYLDFGKALIELGRADDAARVFKIYADLRPSDSESILSIANMLKDKGLGKEAMGFFDRLEKKGEEIPLEALKAKHELAKSQGDWENCISILKELFEKDQNAKYLVELGNAFVQIKNMTEAVAVLEQAIELEEGNVDAWYLLAQCYFNEGSYSEAEEAVDVAISLKAGHMDAYTLGVQVARQLNDNEKIIDYAKRALQYAPENAYFLEALGDAHSAVGKNEEALPAYANASKHSGDLNVLMKGGKLAYSMRRFTEAEGIFSRGREMAPTNSEVQKYYGLLLWKRGDPNAEPYVVSALKLLRNDGELWNAMGGIMLKKGDASTAEQAFDRAISLENREGYLGKARALTMLGRRGEAGEALAQVIHDGSADTGILLEYATLMIDSGDHEEATRAIAMLPKDAPLAERKRAVMLKARCYELVGDLKGALELYASQRDDPDALFRAAKIYVGRREFDKATASLESLFKLNDSHIEGLKLKSSMLESLEEIEAALQLSDKVSSIIPDDQETLWRRVDLLRRLGKIDQTVQLYDHIVSLNPSDSKARAERIEVLRSLGRGDRLVAEYDAILRSDPNDIGALIGKGNLLVDSSRTQDQDAGLACFKKVLTKDPGNLDATLGLAKGYAARGKVDEAEATLSDAEVFSTARALMEKGTILDQIGKQTAALQAYVQSLRIEQDPRAYVLTANLLLKMKEFPKAEEMANRALGKDEKAQGAKRARGLALIGMGRGDEGYAELKKAGESEPNADAYAELAEMARQLGKTDDAINAYDNATRLDPRRIRAWISKGELYLTKGKTSFAIECAKKALGINPNVIDALLLQSKASIASGDAKGALRCAESLQTLVMKDKDALPAKIKVEAFKLLAKAYDLMGNHDMAYKTIEVYSNVVPELKTDVEGMCIIGRSLLKRGFPEQGEQWLIKALASDRANVDVIRELATLYISQKRMELADRVLQDVDEGKDILLLKGELYERSGRVFDALSSYAKILSTGDDIEVLRKVVDLLMKAGRFAESLEYAERALKLAPDDVSMVRSAGDSYIKLGRYREALKSFDRVYKKTKGPTAALGKGMALYHLNKYQEARTALENLSKRLEGGDAITCQLYLSRTFRALGEGERALKASDPLRRGFPSNNEVLEEYIHCLEGLGRRSEVITIYSEMVARDPMNVDARRSLVDHLMKAGRNREAAEEAMRIVSLAPKMKEAHVWACESYVKAGDLDTALKVADEAIVTFDSDASMWRMKGDLYLGVGRPDDALECFDRALSIDQESYEGHLKKGTALFMKGEIQLAVDSIDEALAIDGSRSDSWSELGRVLFCSGREAEAKLCFEHAIELDPRNEGAQLGLVELDISQGRTDEAMALAQNIKDKGSARYIYDATLIHEGKGEHAQALTLVGKGLERYDDANLHSLKAHTLLEMGRFEDALESATHSLALRKDDDVALLRAIILARMNDHSEALDLLGSQGLIDSPEGSYVRGSILQMVHDEKGWGSLAMTEDDVLRASLEALEKAASMRSGKKKYHTALGLAYLKSGKLEKSLASLDRSLELGDSALAWLGKANAYQELEMFTDSVRAANHSISLDAKSPEAWFVKGVSEIGLNDLTNAKVSFDRCLALRDHPAVWRAVAYTLLQQGKVMDALTCLDKVILHHTDSSQAFVEKGITLIEARMLKDAIRAFDNALRLDRRSTEAWNGRGITLAYLGKTSESVKCFREAEKLGDPATSKFNTGVAYALAEDYVPAVQEFEDVLKSGKDEEAEINKQHALTEMRRRGRDEQ